MPIPTAAAPAATAISWCLLAGDGRELASHDADRPYYAASTIKLHVLLAALRAVEAGTLDLDAQVPATRTFTGVDGAAFTLGGDHLDPTHPAEGTPIALRELLVRMIDRSSNEATDHVLALVGLDAVAAEIAGLGLRATRVERGIGDPAALARGLTNETSARDLARTMRAIITGDGLAAPSRELARAALAAQRIRIISAALHTAVPTFTKSGSIDGFRHDVAAVGDPDVGARVLAVLTAGWPEVRADAHIGRVARGLLPDLAG